MTPVEAAVAALRAGDLVLLPTETVYGLAAAAWNPDAVARLFAAKGRPRFNPLIAHVADRAGAETLARFDANAARLAARYWPGPLTLVLPALVVGEGAPVCDLARAGLASVAVRAPAHPIAQAVLRAFGGAIVAPSANRSGRPSPTTFTDACEETGAAAAVALDGGDCAVGVESSVVACLGGAPRWLRAGGVARADVEACVGPLGRDDDDAHRSPGRLALHYAPDAPLRLEAAAPRAGEAFLAFGPAAEDARTWNLSPAGDTVDAARRLFACLRAADRTKPTAIAVAPIPQLGLGEAINDRLRRAAGFIG